MDDHPSINIQLIPLGKNKGVGHARNVGLSNCSGEYVFFLDSDDFINPQVLLKMLVHLKENPEEDLVFCDTVDLVDKELQSKSIFSFLNYFNINKDMSNINKIEFPAICFGGVCWRYLIKKQFLDYHGIKFGENGWGEDIFFTSQIYKNMTSFGVIKDVGLYHRIYSGATSTINVPMVIQFNETYLNILKKYNFNNSVLTVEVLYIYIPRIFSSLDLSLKEFKKLFDKLLNVIFKNNEMPLLFPYNLFYQCILNEDEEQYYNFKKITKSKNT